MARVVVNVMPKAEILDPQGQAVVRALGRLNIKGITDVRQGKRFEIEVDENISTEELEHMAETLLANTVIEEFDIVFEAATGAAQ
ncbi:phosphoribosylformylglycinamidine synthase subunit PurS [Corynebacterium sp. ES2794-CONJ1]|uniref:phosphoribosylformylglycinamidine synthase subunit PurS n=1 Tax=unclassified Corynebacterium TaxID=2624378 RepID=UPI002168F719|nr:MULTISPECIES: phosphoribosylformylglycinamidine synthase subunit PurS [unclassified Corynebacterium]MCS4491895.1 phosphoribosylformylglycinamidine synthase subunit PurS [Corynebacterium sp. ES2715-CONJ3]MCU9519401.1 phosphoribosylformylglycinamidine synthase subunit PurS [Corynebacterium sp. ES2794-CONJ1]